MAFTYSDPAKRIDAVLAQNAQLDRVPDLLAELRDADVRHARTQGSDDYLNVLKLQHETLGIITDAFGMNLDDNLNWLATEALASCGYSIKEGCYVPSGRAA